MDADTSSSNHDTSSDSSSSSSSSAEGYTPGQAIQVIMEVAADICENLSDEPQAWYALIHREDEVVLALKALQLPPTLKQLLQAAADRAGVTGDPDIRQVLALLTHYLEVRGGSYLRMVESH